MVATSPHVLVVPNRMAAKSVDDLVRLARANPGKLTYASAGVATTFHLCTEMFKDATWHLHPARALPRRRPGAARYAFGQVDMSFPTLSAALPHGEAGALRALAVTGVARSPLLPEVPTLREVQVAAARLPVPAVARAARARPARRREIVAPPERRAAPGACVSADLREKFQAQAFEPFVTSRRRREVHRRRGRALSRTHQDSRHHRELTAAERASGRGSTLLEFAPHEFFIVDDDPDILSLVSRPAHRSGPRGGGAPPPAAARCRTSPRSCPTAYHRL
jgi:hypothetical protein